MPILDMPLEQLQQYRGSSPCPKDIDAYWDAALEEMRSVDPQIELVPAQYQFPNAECFDLFFTGVRGARIHAKYARPKGVTKPVPSAVHFHGYAGASLDWTELLAYTGQGFCMASMDCRGQGGISQDVGGTVGNTLFGHITRGLSNHSPHDLLVRHLFLDTAQLAGILMSFDEVDETRVMAQGGSQGGGLTFACAALEPRIWKACARYPFLSDYKRVWHMDLDLNAYEDLRTYFRLYDPRHEREDEIFERLGYIDIQNLAKRIRAKVLMFTGLIDNICPPSSQFAAYNKITAPKRTLIYPDFGHETLRDVETLTFQFFLED